MAGEAGSLLAAVATKSKGKEMSLAARSPFTSRSTLRTWTSSVTSTRLGMEEPSTTWTPAAAGSASGAGLLMVTAGSCL